MLKQTRVLRLLVFVMLALPLALLAQATENPTTPAPAAEAQDLASFLDSLAAQPSPDGQTFTPAPENRIQYCTYQPCPTGQRCWYCNRNWICLWEYPDPDHVPAGCTAGGGGVQ